MTDPFDNLDGLRVLQEPVLSSPGPVRKQALAPIREVGAWVPWPLVERVVRLKLEPPSRWQVFLVVLLTSCRFGGGEARLSVAEIAERTELSERTVRSSLADLARAGLVARPSRYRKLVVTLSPSVPRV